MTRLGKPDAAALAARWINDESGAAASSSWPFGQSEGVRWPAGATAALVVGLLLTPGCTRGGGQTPAAVSADAQLLRAAASGTDAAVVEALERRANIEARDQRGRTALLLAASEDHITVATILVGRGADVNAVDDQQDTPFLVTGVTGSVGMLEAMLPGKPNTRLRNRFGGVAVIPAAERGHAAYVKAVLDTTDIEVNHVNDLGWTALLEAVILGDGGPRHQEVVRELLAHGADRTFADRDGVTAYEHAVARGQREVAALLGG